MCVFISLSCHSASRVRESLMMKPSIVYWADQQTNKKNQLFQWELFRLIQSTLNANQEEREPTKNAWKEGGSEDEGPESHHHSQQCADTSAQRGWLNWYSKLVKLGNKVEGRGRRWGLNRKILLLKKTCFIFILWKRRRSLPSLCLSVRPRLASSHWGRLWKCRPLCSFIIHISAADE